MNENDKLQGLLLKCSSNLDMIEHAIQEELVKPLHLQRVQFLTFLDKEQAVYSFGVWLLKELGKEE